MSPKDEFSAEDLASQLVDAVFDHDTAKIDALLDRNDVASFINHPNKEGHLGLTIAVQDNKKDIVRALLDHGADPNRLDKVGDVPLMEAAIHDSELCRMLLEKGANPNYIDELGRTPLTETVAGDRVEIAKTLLDAKADPNLQNPDGESPLMVAATYNAIEIVRLLLELGADPNLQDKEGQTALMNSISRDAMTEELLRHNPNLNLQDQHGYTALMIAASGKYRAELLRKMLEMGADPNLRTQTDEFGGSPGRAALIQAAWNNCVECAGTLLDHGADVNAQRDNGLTALLTALERGHTDMARLLLERGANPEARLSDGTSALDIATRGGHKEVADLLRDAIAKRQAAGKPQSWADSVKRTDIGPGRVGGA